MKIRYYYYKFNYYINNYNDITCIFTNSELSDFEKYNAIRLLTYYLVYNYFTFKTLKKNIKKYNITFVKVNKDINKYNGYLYFVNNNEYIIKHNMRCLLYNVLLYKKRNIINMYINLLFNNNMFSNIIHNDIIYYVLYKIYCLNMSYYRYLKNNTYLINKNIYYKVQQEMFKNKHFLFRINKCTLCLIKYVNILYK